MPIVKERVKYTPEDVFMTESVAAINLPDYYTGYDDVMKIFKEYFDMSTSKNRRQLLSMNEAEHNTLLAKLTTKLYTHIIKKTDKIDFGEIPKTKGDITKLSNYDDVIDVTGILKNILKEYKQDTEPVDQISMAIANIQTRKDLFYRAFSTNCDLPMMMYNEIVLGIYTGISYLISACIEFVKAPKDESFTISLDKVAYNKSKDHMIYDSLKKFNKACEKGQLDTAFDAIVKKKIKTFKEDATVLDEVGPAFVPLLLAAIGIPGIIFLITKGIPILRELSYLYFHARTSIADHCQMQADLLQMNAYNVENNNTIDIMRREKIVDKQLKIADRFRKLANKIAIDAKKAEADANADMKNINREFDPEEIEAVELVASDDSGSALF